MTGQSAAAAAAETAEATRQIRGRPLTLPRGLSREQATLSALSAVSARARGREGADRIAVEGALVGRVGTLGGAWGGSRDLVRQQATVWAAEACASRVGLELEHPSWG